MKMKFLLLFLIFLKSIQVQACDPAADFIKNSPRGTPTTTYFSNFELLPNDMLQHIFSYCERTIPLISLNNHFFKLLTGYERTTPITYGFGFPPPYFHLNIARDKVRFLSVNQKAAEKKSQRIPSYILYSLTQKIENDHIVTTFDHYGNYLKNSSITKLIINSNFETCVFNATLLENLPNLTSLTFKWELPVNNTAYASDIIKKNVDLSRDLITALGKNANLKEFNFYSHSPEQDQIFLNFLEKNKKITSLMPFLSENHEGMKNDTYYFQKIPQLLKLMKLLEKSQSITHLHLKINNWGAFPSGHEVNLQNYAEYSKMGEKILESFYNLLTNNKLITHLKLEGYMGLNNERGVQTLLNGLGANKTITHFKTTSSVLRIDDLGRKLSSLNFSNLKIDNNITRTECDRIDLLNKSSKIQALSLINTNIPQIRNAFNLFYLKNLDLSKGAFKPSYLKNTFKQLAQNTSLQQLNLSGTKMSFETASVLLKALENNTSLKDLDLGRNYITHSQAQVLKNLKRNFDISFEPTFKPRQIRKKVNERRKRISSSQNTVSNKRRRLN